MAHREVSGEDLRERLFETFRDRGVLESMKSILRKKLITELRASGDINLTLERNAKSPESLFVHVANSIIADHLKQFGYEYSRAVFLPESGLSVSKQLTTSEILYLLHVEPTSSLYKSLMSFQPDPGGKGSLWEYIVQLVSMYGGGSKTSYGTQTDEFQYPSGLSSVDQEVQRLQKLFSDDLERHKVAETERGEEQMQLVRRQCERRMMEEMEAEMESFRKVELERARLQERQKWIAEIDLIREQKAELARGISDEKRKWERETSLAQEQMANTLREKEKEVEQQLKRYQEILQETKQSKERLLQEGSMQGLTEKDNDANAGELLTNYAKKLDAANESLQLKENILAQMEGRYEEMLKTEMERYKQELEVEFQRKLEDLEFREATFRADKERFDKERAKTETDEVVPLRVEELTTNSHSMSYAHVQHMNEVLTRHLDEMKDYKELKASEQAQRSVVESLRQQLSEKVKDSVHQQVEYDKVTKEASENISRLNSELTELRHRVASVTEQSDGFRNASEDLTAQLEQERFANHALRTLYQEQLRQQKELMKEFEHFQTATGLTGQGLVTDDERITAMAGSGDRPARIPSQEPTGATTATDVDDVTDEESSSGTCVAASNEMLERMDRQAEELDEIFTNFLSGVADTNNHSVSGQDSILRRLRNAFRNTPMPASPATQRERPSSAVAHPAVISDPLVADRSLGVDSLIESFLPLSSQDGGYVVPPTHPVRLESNVRSSVSGGGSNAGFLSDHTLPLKQVPHESIPRSSVTGGDRVAGSLADSFLSDHTLSLRQAPHESIPRSSVSGGDRAAGSLADGLSDHTLSLRQVPHESILRSSVSGGDRAAGSLADGLSDHTLSLRQVPHESIPRSSVSGGDRAAGSLADSFLSDHTLSLRQAPHESIPRSSVSGDDRAADSLNAGFLSDHLHESIPRSSVSGGDMVAGFINAGFSSDHTLSANAVTRESIARRSMTDGFLSDQYFNAKESAAKGSALGIEACYPNYSTRCRLSVVASGTMFQRTVDPVVGGSETDGLMVGASPLAYRHAGDLSATTEAREPSSPPVITDTPYRAERSFSRLDDAARDTMFANTGPRETIARNSVSGAGDRASVAMTPSDQYLIANAKPTAKDSVSGDDRALGSTSDIFLSDRHLIANAAPTAKDSDRALGSMNDSLISDQYLSANDAKPSANGFVSDVAAGYSGYPSRCLLSVMTSGSISGLPPDYDSAVGGSVTDGSTVRDAPLAYRSVGDLSATTEAREPRAERSSSMLEDAASDRAGTAGSFVAPIISRRAGSELEESREQRVFKQFDHEMPEGRTREEREKQRDREVDQHLLEELESQEEEVRSILDLEDMEEDTWLVDAGNFKSPSTAADKHDQSAWSSEQREASGFHDNEQDYDFDQDPHFTGLDRDDIESFYPDHVDASESSW